VGLSFTQILFTVVVAVAVWRVVGFFERRRRLERSGRDDRRAVDVAKCRRCGTYVPTGEPCPHCGEGAERGG
jgi:ribosomal protein L32